MLVAYDGKAWETDQFMRMDRTRFGEHSGSELQTVSLDDPSTYRLLEEVPTLLLYETCSPGENAALVRVGKVHDISIDPRHIRFRFSETGRLPRNVLEEFAEHLDIHQFAFNRTHWAVKDGDLPKHVLAKVAQIFDVFLCHNSKDKPAVIQLGNELKARGLRVWLDAWEIPPGARWKDSLEEIIETCRSAAVCVADNGTGPWEDLEIQALLERWVTKKAEGTHPPIIPTLLPGAPADVSLPLFLKAFGWVSLRDGFTAKGIDLLEWGITGIKANTLEGGSHDG